MSNTLLTTLFILSLIATIVSIIVFGTQTGLYGIIVTLVVAVVLGANNIN